MPGSPKRYTQDHWTQEAFERAITAPTEADRQMWAETAWRWGDNHPLIPMSAEERAAMATKQKAATEKIASTPEEVDRFHAETRRLSARILGPEAARFYAEHFGIVVTPEEDRGR